MQAKIGKLAIIAGAGDYPIQVANHCQLMQIDHIILPIMGQFSVNDYHLKQNIYPIDIGKIGKFLKILKEHNVTDVILAGSVKKPSLNNIKVDFEGGKLITKLLAIKILGDNEILSTIIKFIEKKGYNVRSTQEILPNLLIKKDCLTNIKPSKQDLLDIAVATKVIESMGKLDIGQAVIVENKTIIAIEAIEGTDAMIERSFSLKLSNNKNGILYKSVKPGQNFRADLPTIGLTTVKMAIKAKLNGIALKADTSIFLQKDEAIALANQHGLFIIGV